MKDLNPKEVYDLRGITEEQKKELLLKLQTIEKYWEDSHLIPMSTKVYLRYYCDGWCFGDMKEIYPTTHISTLFEKSLEQELEETVTKVAELKKQIEERDKPKVGDVCKFWDDEEKEYHISILKEIDDNDHDDDFRFLSTCNWNIHAKKLTQQEVIDLLFNQK